MTFRSFAAHKVLLAWQKIVGHSFFYQPTFNATNRLLPGGRHYRECDARLRFMREHIPFEQLGSYTDIGCNLGFFPISIAFAYPNMRATGLEKNVAEICYAKLTAELNGLAQAVIFKRFLLSPETVESLPRADVISLIAVFHHIEQSFGMQNAERILAALAHRCRYFVFETGQPNEKRHPWSEHVRYMEPDSEGWLKSLLGRSGFETIANTEVSSHGASTRHFFICRSMA